MPLGTASTTAHAQYVAAGALKGKRPCESAEQQEFGKESPTEEVRRRNGASLAGGNKFKEPMVDHLGPRYQYRPPPPGH